MLFPAEAPSLAALRDTIIRHRVSTMWLTAGLFHQIVEGDVLALRGVRQLLAGGDVLSVSHVQRVLAALPGMSADQRVRPDRKHHVQLLLPDPSCERF